MCPGPAAGIPGLQSRVCTHLPERPPFMQLSPSIFKAYDIRGVVPATLTEEVAYALGRAFGQVALREGERTVAVGRDGRLSGPSLSAALVRGLTGRGRGRDRHRHGHHAHAVLCGQHAVQQRHPGDGQPQPADYNGFKMVMAGRAIHGEEIQALRRLMESSGQWPRARRHGTVRLVNVLAPYRDRIVGDVKLARPMKIVIDSGNGIGRRFGARHLPRAGLRGDRAVQRRGRQLSQPPPRPEQAREPARPDPRAETTATPSWAWPLTATATAWASSPRTARTSTPTGR
jgi:hypothetical protein